MLQSSGLLERRHRVLGTRSPIFYDEPLQLVRGSGVWVEDSSGRRFLDAYNNVPHVGHCHPHVLEALCRQAGLININTRYLHENVVEYAERLTATFHPELSAAMLTCTGTEANELALRMARFLTGGEGIIVSAFSYHGNSRSLAEATTGLPAPEALASHVRAVDIPDLSGYDGDPEILAKDYAERVKAAVESLLEAGYKPAALLFDTLFSTEGLPSVPPGYLEQAVAHVRAAGGMFIADEVQPGLGRVGDHMWGYQAYDVVPDFVTMGKSLGNGHPLAGLVTKRDYLEAFTAKALYFNTFAGNPVSAAVGTAVLEVIEEEGLRDNARKVGEHLQRGLEHLRAKHSLIANVRGKGLFFGIDLVEEDGRPAASKTRRLIHAMRDRGILISRIGPRDNVLKMRPPLPFFVDHADLLISTLDDAITCL
ncbi:aminotransferase class III-fold pyridoxal phosphate-dependent enzyme [Phyllobacterium zundukense]|uniref:Aspartate aminotransferase family protein n=1 Tax=Phyllobacterium zundukense TaxID=1867719 RepID=A0A2N9VYH3_9HYPH|nr:aminotransferase class III-fold pyridoxal phosphate-dependent enzyme [Phyllobacterium zundukense]ATU95129.1 aspartate aminotransferase family protein [Phyllobacterium zundukense]PIO44541.1 aspartate aminotransferase family protein [Phyllobacterium zundukense]